MQSQLLRQEELQRTHFSFAMRLGLPSTCSVNGPVSYLGGIRDLWVMGLVNKEMSIICRKPAVQKNLISRNWTRLMKSTGTGIDPEEFSTLLQSHQCVVAGAFALQSVTGVNFGPGRENGPNMQVYCTTSGYKEVLHYLENLGYIPQRQWISSIRISLWTGFQSILSCEFSWLKHIATSRNDGIWKERPQVERRYLS